MEFEWRCLRCRKGTAAAAVVGLPCDPFPPKPNAVLQSTSVPWHFGYISTCVLFWGSVHLGRGRRCRTYPAGNDCSREYPSLSDCIPTRFDIYDVPLVTDPGVFEVFLRWSTNVLCADGSLKDDRPGRLRKHQQGHGGLRRKT